MQSRTFTDFYVGFGKLTGKVRKKTWNFIETGEWLSIVPCTLQTAAFVQSAFVISHLDMDCRFEVDTLLLQIVKLVS